MYLKKIELSNFKSFADKIKLNFSPGINTIVGPNGCGKSNILDAIRWVLGEQKTTILRSKQMDEIIFAGTHKRKPSGMTQVAITLDNSDGSLPFDQPEVIIARRLYRDGGGQYILNNKTMRLKDIQEMIADTGVGQGALFVLSGREVEKVLSPNSDERRMILEETAGINKYQIRKKETLRKLSLVKENVSRLNDILQEVSRQMDMLQKQLNKLRRYQTLKEKLSTLECRLVLIDMGTQETQEKEHAGKIEKLEEKRTNLDRDIEKQRFEVYSKEKERGRLSSAFEKEREESSRRNKEEAQIRSQRELTLEKIRQAESSLEDYSNNYKRLDNRLEATRKKIEKYEKEIEEENKLLQSAQAGLKLASEEFGAGETNLSGTKEEIDKFIQEIDKIREDIRTFTVEQRNLENILENENKRKNENENRAGKLIGELEKSEEIISSEEEKLAKFEVEKREAREENEAVQTRYSSLYKRLSDEENQIRKLKESIHAKTSEIAILLREEENFRGFSGAFQRVMKARDFLPSITPVHSVIRVVEKYETAVDVVLGAHFQSLITQNRKDAGLCIDFLKQERAGRLTFFPLDMERTGSDLPYLPIDLPGAIDWARNLVECDSLYRDILDIICGKTFIVDSLKSAYDIYGIQKRNRAFIPRMVTLDGDVLDFNGAVTGGRHRTDRSQILSRQRRMREMEKKVKLMAREFEECNSGIKSDREVLARIDEERKSLSAKVTRLDDEIRSTGGQLNILKRLRESASLDLKQIEESESKIGGEIEGYKKKTSQLKTKISAMEQDIKEKEIVLGDMKDNHKSRFAKLDELKSTLAQKKKQIDNIVHNRRLLESKIESEKEYISQVESDINTVNEKIENKKAEIGNLNGGLRDISNRQSVLKLKMKGLTIALESSKKDLSRVDVELETARNKLEVLLKDKGSLDNQQGELRIKKIELDSNRRYLEDRLVGFNKVTRKSARRMSIERDRVKDDIEKKRNLIQNFDAINFSAEEEFSEHKARYEEMKRQIDDLQESSKRLRKIISEMDTVSVKSLEDTLQKLNDVFAVLFKKIFGGGRASVSFSEPENKLESGVDIMVQPPGKRATNMNLLSSGEKSLTAVTFLFALLSIKPGPFVVLDELDAPLDDSNVAKISLLIKEFSQKSQFIVITHNRKTMESADNMFGITMEEPGVSKLVSVKMVEDGDQKPEGG
ncbi:MAG: chromosome segregation protein SMC [Candidatus Eremiobacteraeota bacterium]|nr:chromosome segregation protein SMC [Candidatus Eremiobacteraeota bacterium]